MRIVTWNVNGIRAAIRKGLDKFIEKIDADIWMLQEVRCLEEQLPKDWAIPEGFEMILHPAQKKGYSGVATISNCEMAEVGRGMQGSVDPTDSEGRVLVTKHENITLVNTYLPSGSSKEERQQFKENWMNQWITHCCIGCCGSKQWVARRSSARFESLKTKPAGNLSLNLRGRRGTTG